MSAYTPRTGAACACKRGVQRDNCPTCEGTGMVIDFRAIHAARLAPTVPDPVADTARALAGLWNEERAHREANRPNMPGAREYSHDAACQRMVAVRAAAQAIGPQVYAAFCALVTGDAGREPGVRS